MERSHKKCPEEHRAGWRVVVAAGMPLLRFNFYTSHFSCRVRLLVLTDKTNNDALLALVPIKSDPNGIARILTAPRSDMFFLANGSCYPLWWCTNPRTLFIVISLWCPLYHHLHAFRMDTSGFVRLISPMRAS